MFWGQGGELVDGNGKAVFGIGANREKMLNILEFYKELVDKGYRLVAWPITATKPTSTLKWQPAKLHVLGRQLASCSVGFNHRQRRLG
jgi:hypothetical protein